jgi:hypothetical protein
VPDTAADYIVRLMVNVRLATNASVRPASASPLSDVMISAPKEDSTVFEFSVYQRDTVERRKLTSIWEASVTGKQEHFRANEEQLVLSVFAHLGETFEGEIPFQKKG